jgi:hypothetical protein
MFLRVETIETEHTRTSKNGMVHTYKRKKKTVILRCDNCDTVFERDLKKMQRKRLSNNYFHCCPGCDSKRFAQRKGIEKKKIWDMPASIDWPVGKY